MKNYIISVLCVSVVYQIVTVISPEKRSINKYVSFVGALIIALTILSPLATGLDKISINNLLESNYDLHDNSDKTNESENALKYQAKQVSYVCSKMLGIELGEINTKISTNNKGGIEKIQLYIDKENEKSKSVENKLSEIFGYDISIIKR